VLELTPTPLEHGDRVDDNVSRAPVVELSSTERDIIQLLVRGLSNAEIAQTRKRSPRTVANQLQKIYQKLGVSSRVELVSKLAESPAAVRSSTSRTPPKARAGR
jgi:DNA-binding NarL/FixJ family response regulator